MSSGRSARGHSSAIAEVQGEATALIGADGIESLAIYLVDHPDAGDVIPGSGGVRKLRWRPIAVEVVAQTELAVSWQCFFQVDAGLK